MTESSKRLTIVPAEQKREITAFLKLASRLNWEVDAIDDLGVHLRQKKTYSDGYLLVGALTALVIIGFLVWLVGLLDYLSRSDRVLFIPHEDIKGPCALKAADLLV